MMEVFSFGDLPFYNQTTAQFLAACQTYMFQVPPAVREHIWACWMPYKRITAAQLERELEILCACMGLSTGLN